jgi:plastocyanin
MKTRRILSPLTGMIMLVMSFFFLTSNTGATIHVVQFGGALGFNFSPSSFSAQVGDTVHWVGDFTMHTVTSTSVPAGAASFNNTSGTSFNYIITVPGTYDYHCNFHYTLGMIGSFTATASGIRQESKGGNTASPELLEISANPIGHNGATIRFTVLRPQQITLAIYTMDGRALATLAQGKKEAGNYQVALPVDLLANGTYICRMTGNSTDTKIISIIK